MRYAFFDAENCLDVKVVIFSCLLDLALRLKLAAGTETIKLNLKRVLREVPEAGPGERQRLLLAHGRALHRGEDALPTPAPSREKAWSSGILRQYCVRGTSGSTPIVSDQKRCLLEPFEPWLLTAQ